jgi:hypothetical protein
MLRGDEALDTVDVYRRRKGFRSRHAACCDLLKQAKNIGLHRRDLTPELVRAAIAQADPDH